MTRRINQAGLNIVKHYEGCELEAYLCPARVWTIGYGHTHNVRKGMVWTQTKADRQLEEDLRQFEEGVEEMVKIPISQNAFAALVSLSFNIGLEALRGSTLMRKLNKGELSMASEEFARWNKSGARVLPGLTRRRLAERDLFLRKDPL
jgi:lysozyme